MGKGTCGMLIVCDELSPGLFRASLDDGTVFTVNPGPDYSMPQIGCRVLVFLRDLPGKKIPHAMELVTEIPDFHYDQMIREKYEQEVPA